MIYYLHEDSAESAKMLDDKSLDKQIKAIAQVLCNVHWRFVNLNSAKEVEVATNKIPIKASNNYFNDVYSRWASECIANYKMLVDIGLACCEEYDYRHMDLRQKHDYLPGLHKMLKVMVWARDNVPELPWGCRFLNDGESISFPLVIPKTYFPKFIPIKYVYDEDKTEYIKYCYRNYYRAKIEQASNKVYSVIDDSVTCKCCDNRIGITKKPKWTRRKKPEWLNV